MPVISHLNANAARLVAILQGRLNTVARRRTQTNESVMKSRPPALSEYREERTLLHQHDRPETGFTALRVLWTASLG